MVNMPRPNYFEPVAGIKFEIKFLSLNICYVIYVLLWIKYGSWFEIILVFILFKFKNRPNISGIRVVKNHDKKFKWRDIKS